MGRGAATTTGLTATTGNERGSAADSSGRRDSTSLQMLASGTQAVGAFAPPAASRAVRSVSPNASGSVETTFVVVHRPSTSEAVPRSKAAAALVRTGASEADALMVSGTRAGPQDRASPASWLSG